jgi:hypothetical protein
VECPALQRVAHAWPEFSRSSFDLIVSGSKELRTMCLVFSLIMLFTLFPSVALISIPTSAASCFNLAARGPWGVRISSMQLVSRKFLWPMEIIILSFQEIIV